MNLGLQHPTYNPSGSKLASDNKHWYDTAIEFNSTADCFNPSKLSTSSGVIGGSSGSLSQYEFADAIYAGQVQDLRLNANKQDPNRLMEDAIRKAVAGETRGKGKQVFSTVYADAGSGENPSASRLWIKETDAIFRLYMELADHSFEVGQRGYMYDATDGIIVRFTIGTLSVDTFIAADFEVLTGQVLTDLQTGTGNEVYYILEKELTPEYDSLPWVDIVGSPANIMATHNNGSVGQWIPV